VHVVHLSSDGIIEDCNAAVPNNLGVRRDEIVGQPLARFVTEADAARSVTCDCRSPACEVLNWKRLRARDAPVYSEADDARIRKCLHASTAHRRQTAAGSIIDDPSNRTISTSVEGFADTIVTCGGTKP